MTRLPRDPVAVKACRHAIGSAARPEEARDKTLNLNPRSAHSPVIGPRPITRVDGGGLSREGQPTSYYTIQASDANHQGHSVLVVMFDVGMPLIADIGENRARRGLECAGRQLHLRSSRRPPLEPPTERPRHPRRCTGCGE